MGVRVCLQEVSTYGRFNMYMQGLSRKIAGTAVWYLFMGDVPLQKVSISGGSTTTVLKL